MFEQLTRMRTSPNPLAPLTNGSRGADGPIPATVTSVVPTERVSRSTHVESVHRQIETTWVQVIEDLPMYVAFSVIVVLLTPVNVPNQVAVFGVVLAEFTTR